MKISRVFLILGTACNFQCTYCLQHDARSEQIKAHVDEKVLKFLKNLAEDTNNTNKRITITFFGGEPLLYKDAIRYIVNYLQPFKKRFYLNIITNGSLIDDEWVTFCNQNNISISLSWDVRNVKDTRKRNILEEKWDVVSKINNMCLLGTNSTKNYIKDFLDDVSVYDYKYRKIHNKQLRVFIEELNNKCHNCDDISNFDLERVNREAKEFVDVYDKEQFCSPYYYYANRIMNRFIKRIKCNSIGKHSFCGNGYSIVNVDMQGNLYLCHNDNKIIANLSDEPQEQERKMQEADRFNDIINGMCKDCELRTFCRGFCVLLDDETKKKYYCDWAKAKLYAIYRIYK